MLFSESFKNWTVQLLRWSEKYTKTDMRYVTHGGIWSVIGQISAACSSFALAIVIGKFLPQDVYGQYKYVIAAIALFSTFSLTGLSTGVFQSVARGFDGALFEGFWLNIRWSALVFLGAFCLSIYYYFQGNFELAASMLIGGSLSPLLTSANLATGFLGAKKDFRRQTIYFDIIQNFVPAGALIATILLTPNFLALVIVYFLSNTLITLYLYRRTINAYRPLRTRDPGMLTYSKHISLMGILGGIAGNIDQILLFHYMGAPDLAIYNFATAIPDQLKGFSKMLDTMLQARFASRTDTDIRGGMRNKMFWLFISSTIFVVFYIPLAPLIFHILFTKYSDAIFYSQLYVLSWLTLTLAPAASYLTIKKRVKGLYVSSVLGNAFQIGAMCVGVMYGGLMGLITARIAGRVFGAVLNYSLFLYTAYRDKVDPNTI